MIVLAYLWLLALVPLLVEKEDKEVQWHAKHGIVLLVAEIVLWIVLSILSMVVGMALPMVGCAFSLLFLVLWVGILIVHIMCIVKGINGGRFLIPGLSNYADRF
ncbi:MAG TPA: hypothetical protein VG538_01600 [Vicinamibacterales bacterium]|jgi:uncharacterized membrane protein|nr:hypothetical protein [Vicinamibacterales bacterium]